MDVGTWSLFLLPLVATLCYSRRMIRCWLFCVIAAVSLAQGLSCFAASYQLITGQEVVGEPLAPDTRGVIIKGADGGLSERIPWTNFTQGALQQLAQALPKSQRLIEPFLIEDEPEPAQKARQEIRFTPPPRLNRPDPKAGIGALFSSPLSAVLLLLVYAANLYAAYEVSLFRNYPPAMVIGVAAVAPIIGPIIFLCMPTYIPKEAPQQLSAEQEVAHEHTVAMEQVIAAHEAEAAAAEAHAAKSAHPPPVIYQRGTTMFNRRFFETKMSGFLRMVPSEAEKDMVICVKSARGEFVAQRLSKVLPNELYLHVPKSGASSEVAIPYGEIYEIKIQHKDAA